MFKTLFAFGDSLSDAGNDYYHRRRDRPCLSLLQWAFQQREDLGRGPFQEARPRDADAEPHGRP